MSKLQIILRLKILGLIFLLSFCFNACLFERDFQYPTLLFMGNSITLSDTNSSLGWNHTSGMAASNLENDYVHRTLQILKENGHEMQGVLGFRDCEIGVCDGPIEEHINNIDQLNREKPKFVVVQLGENSSELEAMSGKLRHQYHELLNLITQNEVKKIFCISPWGDTSLTISRSKEIVLAMAGFSNVELINITDLVRDSSNYGDPSLYRNAAVRWHPGDLGMNRIAQRLSAAILKEP